MSFGEFTEEENFFFPDLINVTIHLIAAKQLGQA